MNMTVETDLMTARLEPSKPDTREAQPRRMASSALIGGNDLLSDPLPFPHRRQRLHGCPPEQDLWVSSLFLKLFEDLPYLFPPVWHILLLLDQKILRKWVGFEELKQCYQNMRNMYLPSIHLVVSKW